MDGTWGDKLAATELFGRESNLSCIQVNEGDPTLKDLQHASHVLIYATTSKKSIERYETKAIVLMQMRFDGYIGFPGGLVDSGENPAEAVTRELVEEMGWETSIFGTVTQDNHMFTHLDKEKSLVLHFYCKKLTEEEIEKLEVLSLKAVDYGNESLGVIRVPLYTMGDSYRGFPAFLRNNFVGNAKGQLLETLIALKILTRDQVDKALIAQPMGCS